MVASPLSSPYAIVIRYAGTVSRANAATSTTKLRIGRHQARVGPRSRCR